MTTVRLLKSYTLWLLVISFTGMAVYGVKTKVDNRLEKLAQLEKQINREINRIRVLDADLVWLGRPERIARLSDQLLELGPIAPTRIITLDKLSADTAMPQQPENPAAVPNHMLNPPSTTVPQDANDGLQLLIPAGFSGSSIRPLNRSIR